MSRRGGEALVSCVLSQDSGTFPNAASPIAASFSFQGFRMSEASARIIHQLIVDFPVFIPELGIGLLPLPDDLVCLRRYLDFVHGYKKRQRPFASFLTAFNTQLLELKREWPDIIFAITRKDDYDYVTIAISFHGFVEIGYKYGNYRYKGFFISFSQEYVPELQDDRFFETADEAFSELLLWKEKKGYKFKKYEHPKVIDNQFE